MERRALIPLEFDVLNVHGRISGQTIRNVLQYGVRRRKFREMRSWMSGVGSFMQQ